MRLKYKELPSNTRIEKISMGVDPSTSEERWSIDQPRIPIKQIETNYIKNCDTLAGMFDGSITESDHFLDGEARYGDEPVECAIYLDKSARPVRHLMQAVWPQLSEGKFPASAYRNIDKHHWSYLMSPDTKDREYPDSSEISLDNYELNGGNPELLKEHIARLRATFLSSQDVEKLDEDNLIDDVWNYPTRIDGKRVAIIDEVKFSGATLTVADILLRAAVPEAKFDPMFWSNPGLVEWYAYNETTRRNERQVAPKTVPVWYRSDSSEGRGVGDLDPDIASKSKSKVQRIGRFVLSNPLVNALGERIPMDRQAIDIKHDLNLMAESLRSRTIDYVPSGDRSDEDFDYRIYRYYGLTRKEWLKSRRSRR